MLRVRLIWIVAAFAVVLPCTAAGHPDVQPPPAGEAGTSRDNPIADVGGRATRGLIHVFDHNGIVGAYRHDRAMNPDELKAFAEEKSRERRRPARLQHHQPSACQTTMWIQKLSSTTVGGGASTVCTIDVYSVYGTYYLMRSANLTIIGSDASGAGSISDPRNSGSWSASGGCLSSTWQYNGQINIGASSSHNGSVFFGDWLGPVWISC